MARLSLSVLGPYRVLLDGAPIAQPMADKVRALLAYLMLEMRQPHRRQVLGALLWPERPERLARGSLRRALYDLRRAISDDRSDPPFLLTGSDTIQFNPESDHDLDASTFSSLAQDGTSFQEVERAIALYQGDLLADLAIKNSAEFEEWATLTRERLRRQALAACGRLVETLASRGEHDRACIYARRQVEMEPWQEQAHRQLMRLLAVSGQRSAALVQYQTCRRILLEELGVEPEEETVALYLRIQEDGLRSPSSDESPWNRLLAPLTPLVGRRPEIAGIVERLSDPGCRLLSLVGPGGSGKTRLALEAASRLAPTFDRGAHFCALGAVHSVAAIVPALAQAVGLALRTSGGMEPTTHGESPPKQQLLDYLRDKELLLVLDNLEHLLDGADLVVEILSAAPKAKVLVTSRVRLGIPGEHLCHVGGMRCPEFPPSGATPATSRAHSPSPVAAGAADDAQDAMDLFLQTARQLRPDWEPAPQDLAEIGRICHLVDGLPLAIILAASWIEMLSPSEIAQEVGAGSVDFFDADWRGVPEQQRSMRAVFDHSWGLLPEHLRRALASLATFRGDCDAEGARVVAGATLRDLARLVDRSLIHRHANGRYDMHALLREYARGRLDENGETEAARDRHAAHFARLARGWGDQLKGAGQQRAMAEITAVLEDATAAWRWCVRRGRLELLGEMATAMGLYHDYRGLCAQGERLFATATAVNGQPVDHQVAPDGLRLRLLSQLLAWQASFARLAGDIEAGQRLVARSLDLLDVGERAGLDVRAERAHTLWCKWRVLVAYSRSETESFLPQLLELCRELGDQWTAAWALHGLAGDALRADCADKALGYLSESLAIRRAISDSRGIAEELILLAHANLSIGCISEAERQARECVAVYRALGNTAAVAHALHWLSYIVAPLGRAWEQYALQQEVAELLKEQGMRSHRVLHDLSLSNLHLGKYVEAREAALEYLELTEQSGLRAGNSNARLTLGCVCIAAGDYATAAEWLDVNPEELREATNLRDALQPRQVLVVALQAQGKRDEAWAEFRRCVATSARSLEFWVHLTTLGAASVLLADSGKVERAIELCELMVQNPFAASSRCFQDLFASPVALAAAGLPAEVAEAARERGRQRDLVATIRELADEFGSLCG